MLLTWISATCTVMTASPDVLSDLPEFCLHWHVAAASLHPDTKSLESPGIVMPVPALAITVCVWAGMQAGPQTVLPACSVQEGVVGLMTVKLKTIGSNAGTSPLKANTSLPLDSVGWNSPAPPVMAAWPRRVRVFSMVRLCFSPDKVTVMPSAAKMGVFKANVTWTTLSPQGTLLLWPMEYCSHSGQRTARGATSATVLFTTDGSK
mmetsp:Transcript_46369/g.68061  ORF Transcript_46369/g.68061 Transcript_46369/m.68061 type:complete len:206 (-) Transcript_46369:9289-9906(-)